MLPHSHFGFVRTFILILVTASVVIGSVLMSLLGGEQIDMIATVTGPCTEYEAQTSHADVFTLDGEHVASGAVGRWRLIDGATCSASLSVDDVGQHDGYRVTVGSLVGETPIAGTMDLRITLRAG